MLTLLWHAPYYTGSLPRNVMSCDGRYFCHFQPSRLVCLASIVWPYIKEEEKKQQLRSRREPSTSWSPAEDKRTAQFWPHSRWIFPSHTNHYFVCPRFRTF